MNRKALTSIFLVIFIDLLGFGILIPILPYYAKSYGASATVLGFLMMSYSAMQFLFSPLWGKLSDKFGRRPILLTTILGIAISMLFLGLAKTLAGLFLSRLLAGFFGANIATASAYIADNTPPSSRAKGMGMIGAAFGLGFLFGPAIGGFLSQWGYALPAFVASGLAFFNFFFTFAILKEPPLSESVRFDHRHSVDRQHFLKILANKKTFQPILLFFLVTLAMAQLETTFALFVLDRFHLQATSAGYLLAAMAIVMVLIQGGGIGRLARILGETKLVIIGSFVAGVALISAGYAFDLSIFTTSLIIYAVGYAIVNPSLLSLVSQGADPRQQGVTMGVYQSAGSLARIAGPIFAGLLFDRLGIHYPLLVASGFFGLTFLIAITRL
ncbi:MAG: MFS transporter [Deltaproteobacteria bacterium]|nr:MFS transporter [Deltaproteobacteria bacterium]